MPRLFIYVRALCLVLAITIGIVAPVAMLFVGDYRGAALSVVFGFGGQWVTILWVRASAWTRPPGHKCVIAVFSKSTGEYYMVLRNPNTAEVHVRPSNIEEVLAHEGKVHEYDIYKIPSLKYI